MAKKKADSRDVQTRDDAVFEASTREHQQRVAEYMMAVASFLLGRAAAHDASKLEYPERDIFKEFTPKLRALTYGSDEYKWNMSEMQQALDHHYSVNHHHPEFNALNFFTLQGEEVDGMHLVDIIEMFCDWMAATERHADGNIGSSITKNKERFHLSEQLAQIFRNSVDPLRRACNNMQQMGWPERPKTGDSTGVQPVGVSHVPVDSDYRQDCPENEIGRKSEASNEDTIDETAVAEASAIAEVPSSTHARGGHSDSSELARGDPCPRCVGNSLHQVGSTSKLTCPNCWPHPDSRNQKADAIDLAARGANGFSMTMDAKEPGCGDWCPRCNGTRLHQGAASRSRARSSTSKPTCRRCQWPGPDTREQQAAADDAVDRATEAAQGAGFRAGEVDVEKIVTEGLQLDSLPDILAQHIEPDDDCAKGSTKEEMAALNTRQCPHCGNSGERIHFARRQADGTALYGCPECTWIGPLEKLNGWTGEKGSSDES